ncbi:MAG: hypothetical protein JJT76_16535, partial [Clostridiaceae bacterium]|nr:hypothetical protein [Clostridiaceae bacterium]
MTDSLRENKKGIVRPLIIILIAFLILPIMTATVMYFSSENFRYTANDFLTILPGNLGEHFRRIPTSQEKENIKLQIAKNYIDLQEDRLIDKLLIIKGEDEDLYNDLLLLLNRENPMKMRSVKEKLRNKQLSTDLLKRLLEEIDSEKEANIKELANYFSSLKMAEAVREIERTFRSNEVSSEDLALAFENFSRQEAASYLMYLDDDLAYRIKRELKVHTMQEIEKEIKTIESRENDLLKMAKTYEKKSLEDQIQDLGNIDNFRMIDLAVIYKNMPIKTSGKILSYVEDGDFISNLYENINMLEVLSNTEENLTVDLAKTIHIHKNYRSKVKELTSIYERMPMNELTNVVERMLRGNNVYQRHSIGNEEIVFTEEQLVVDVLRQLRPNKVAELMSQLNTEMAV